MRYLILSLIVVMACAPSTPVRAAEEVSDFDRFELWNECDSMGLVVEGISDDAEAIGLSKERIETMVRSRLRAARLYPPESSSLLYVRVAVAGSAFSIDFRYQKAVRDRHDTWSMASTWDAVRTGTHGQPSDFITSHASELTDHFIDEFLRVNAAAC